MRGTSRSGRTPAHAERLIAAGRRWYKIRNGRSTADGHAGRRLVCKAVIIGHARRRMGGAGLKQPERFGWIRHSFVREHFHIGRVRNREQRQSIDEHRFFELVRHANFIAAVLRPQLALAYADVLDGIRPVADTRGFPIAHFSATHEIGHELETAAVPRVEERAGRRLAIELGHAHDARRGPATGRGGRVARGVGTLSAAARC